MTRPIGYLSLVVGAASALVGVFVRSTAPFDGRIPATGVPLDLVVEKGAFAVAAVALCYGAFHLVSRAVVRRTASKRRAHDVRNVLRLAFGVVAGVAVLGVATDQWLGILLSLGVVGFAVTFALQQPLLSFLGWFYIMVNRPYAVGDRIQIGDSRGDVIEVNFLVTTLWEVGGELVTSHQPSGRTVTVPNSVVLSAQVVNYSALFEHVWNELSIQVAYETDLEFARRTMVAAADDLLGDEMERHVGDYRKRLARTAVELDVQTEPTVNAVQRESWVELRLRYLVHPREGTRVRNELYRRILARFNESPERVTFPVGRNR